MTIYKLKEVLNKMKPKTLQRQTEISKTCRDISHISIDDQIINFTELLTCLGNANTFEFLLDQIPKDFCILMTFSNNFHLSEYNLKSCS